MNEQAVESKFAPTQKQADARDLLSKLYREIGISAVAAVLEANKTRSEAAGASREVNLPRPFWEEEAA
jgi:hypothetical protein